MAAIASLSHTAEELAAIAGTEHTLIAGESIVVAPRNTQEVAAIVRYTAEHAVTLGVLGGGTKQEWLRGATPMVIVSLSRLKRVVEHPWQDLTCTVQAGCVWSSMQQELATQGQFVALDPLFPDRATVGGVLATNDSGALRHKYGSLRDLVIGMTLVLTDGTVAKSGGKVVKNVAGYDLCKLMTGSYGTLAIITEATFRLHPRPLHPRSFTVAADHASRLAPLVAAIRSSHLLTQSLQIRRERAGCSLDICLNAHPLAQQDVALMQMVRDERLSMTEASDDLWGARGSLFAVDATVLRIATLPTEVCGYVDGLQGEPSVEVRSVSQAIGLHDVCVRGTREAVEAFVRRLRSAAAGADVTVSLRQAGVLQNLQTFDIAEPVFALMQAVKRQFDPQNILNTGRFF